MSRVYIVDARRSPIGKFLGSLSTVSPVDLAAQVIRPVLEDNGVDGAWIDEVILGNVLSAGHGQNIARQASLKAKIPEKVPAYTVSMVCGSGMKAVMSGYTSIKAGISDLLVVGGVEVMSQAPFIVSHKLRTGKKMGHMELEDTMLKDGLTDAMYGYHMGITAENVAEKYAISRQAQDEFALKSQEKAIQAIESGRFADEIVPITYQDRKKNTITVNKDEHPNYNTSLEKLSKLKPAFKADGTVTAGNASGINDGAAILLLASEKAVSKHGLKPLAEIVEIGQGGLDPQIMGLGPVAAIDNLLAKSEVELRDFGLIELNEAFAAQAIGVIQLLREKYDLPADWEERINVNGGAIALGHPIGASGTRIIVTLLHEMKKRKVTHGLASLCIGGGMGTAVSVQLVEN